MALDHDDEMATCPECSHDLPAWRLCDHDIQDTGPLCPGCCDRVHRHDGREAA